MLTINTTARRDDKPRLNLHLLSRNRDRGSKRKDASKEKTRGHKIAFPTTIMNPTAIVHTNNWVHFARVPVAVVIIIESHYNNAA